MGYIRFFWTALFVVVAFIVSIPIMLIILFVGLFSMPLRDKMTMVVVRIAFKTVLFLSGAKVHITGLENIPKDGPVLYIGNHKSFFDVLTTYSLFPSITSFVAKKQFKKIPGLSWWMMMLHNLFLDRDDIKQGLKTILTAIEYVKSGMSVCIFPEGTRNKTDADMLPFHEGSFKIADKTGCPIVPMTMYNMSAIFEDHFPQIIPQDVYIDFGTPIMPEELSKDERKHIGAYVQNIMMQKYLELKENYSK